MSTEAAAKIPSHQPSKRTRAPPPPPTKKLSFEEDKNGSLSEQEKEGLKNNGSLGAAPEVEERQLTVILPGDKLVKASVKKDTPILELLVMISSKNHLNPTGHMIAQPAPRPRDPPIMLKPNQRLTDVEGDTIYIIARIPKQVFVHKKEDKKSAVYEPTTRITVSSSKNHKMCLRVDPDKTLQDLLPGICDEWGVDPSNHMLRLVNQPEEPLDMSQTLEKTGAIEFLLVDLKGQPAGGEIDLMPEQKKKKGIFGRISKKKKGYEFGEGGVSPETAATTTIENEQRARRHTSPSSFPAPDAPTIQEQDDANSSTLRKRRPAPLPPQAKQNPAGNVGASEDDEKLEDDTSSSTNSLRKRRAPAPPRPTSPPRRSMSLGATSTPKIQDLHVPPPRPISPPQRSSKETTGDSQTFSPIQEDRHRPPKPPRPASIVRRSSVGSLPRPSSTGTPEFIPPPPPYLPPSPGHPQEDVTKLIEEGRLNDSFHENLKDEESREESPPSVHRGSLSSSVTETGLDESFQEAIALGTSEIEEKEDSITITNGEVDRVDKETQDSTVAEAIVEAKGEEKQEAKPGEETPKTEIDEEKKTDDSPQPKKKEKESRAKRELLSHMMTVSLDDDSKDTENYPPHTQADDTHMLLEEKSVHALAFEVTREDTSGDSQDIAEETIQRNREGEERQPVVELKESPKNVKETRKNPVEESAKNGGKEIPVSSREVSVEKLNEQYAALLGQLAALQKQMAMPQQPGIMEMQLQQLQQQILLQQQMISQMMLSSNPQPMVMPLAYQQPMMTPQQQIMLAQQQMLSPPQQMMPPPQQMIPPPQQMMPPMMSQQIVSPHQQILLPQQQMVSPQQQMALTAQQLLVTPPMMYSPSSSTTHPTGNSPLNATATVQAQHTPIPSTHEVTDSTESSSKDNLPNKVEEVPTKEDVQTELQQRPLSPPLKADEVTVGHPTYHFARSRDVPNRKSLVITASPPSTLRSPKQQQRPALYKEESPETRSEENTLSGKNEVTDPQHEKVPSSNTENVNDTHEASLMADVDADVDQNQIQEDGGGDVKDDTKTADNTTGDSSSISAFAVPDTQPSNKSVSSSDLKSPKQKKSGFSLFKKKTPKYSYILSAQKEFSRKSDTECQQTNSNSAKPIDAKAKSDKGAIDLWSR